MTACTIGNASLPIEVIAYATLGGTSSIAQKEYTKKDYKTH